MTPMLLLGAAVMLQAPAVAPMPRAALLPLVLAADAAEEVKVASRLVGRSLADALARHAEVSVIPRQDVDRMAAALVQHMKLGCDDTSCMAALADAMDVELLVRGQLAVRDGIWDLRAVILDKRSAQASRRAGVQGRNLDALLQGVDGVARELTRGTQLRLEDPRLPQRLGVSPSVVEDFRAQANPETPFTQSWTAYIEKHNQESDALALTEGGLLLAGGCALALAALLNAPLSVVAATAVFGNAPVQFTRTAPTGGTYVFPALLGAIWIAGSLATVTVAVALFGGAAVAGVVDLLDVGRVPVARDGCCREERAIRLAAHSSVGKTVAVLLAVGGVATTMLSVVVSLVAATVFSALAAQVLPGLTRGPLSQGPTVGLTTYRVMAGFTLLGAGVVGTLGTLAMAGVPMVGAALLLATRNRDLLEDRAVGAAPPTEH